MSLTNPFHPKNHWCFSGTTTDASPIKTSSTGIATAIEIPALTRTFESEKRSGELGQVFRPQTWEGLEGSFEAMGIDETFEEVFYSPLPIDLRCKTIGYKNDGTTETAGVQMTILIATHPGLGSLGSEQESRSFDFKANTLIYSIGSTEIFRYDPLNYVYSIRGVNLMESIKNSLDCDTPL